MTAYSIYGIPFRSDRVLHDVAPADSGPGSTPEIGVTFAGEVPVSEEWERLPWRVARDRRGDDWSLRVLTAVRAGGVAYRMETSLHGDLTTVLFEPDGSRLSVHWLRVSRDAGAFAEDLSAWVLDAALGFAARLRGRLVLHGNVVVLGGVAVGLLGHKGAGKSTLAAAFHAAGCPVLADDHVVLTQEGDTFLAHPGPPRLRLWPDSLRVLGTRAEDVPRAYSFLEKRRVQLGPDRAGESPGRRDAALPLRALYVLDPRDPGRDMPAVEALPPAAALYQALLFRWSRAPLPAAKAAAELEALARLVRSVPTGCLLRPEGIDSVGDVVEAVRADLRSRAG